MCGEDWKIAGAGGGEGCVSMFTCSTKHGVRWGPKTFGILTSTAPPSPLGLLTGADTLVSHPPLGAFRTVIVTSADQSGEVSPSDRVC